MSTDPYRGAATRAASRYKIPKSLFFQLIHQESGWNPSAKSPAGAIGLTQLMPGTAEGLKVDPHDPLANLDGGARYLRSQFERFGTWRLALAAYNAGPGNVESGAWRQIPETVNYVHSILGASSSSKVPTSTPDQTTVTPPTDHLTATTNLLAASSGPFGDPLSDRIWQNLSQIAAGWKPTSTLQTLNDLMNTKAPQPSAADQVIQPLHQSPQRHPQTGPKRFAASGDPVPRRYLSSVGGEHPTLNLAGFPARDYMAAAGSPVVAPVDGTIIRFSGHDPSVGPTQGPHGPFGWSLYLKGNDGHTYYLTHLGSRSVKVGQKLQAGEQLGTVGDYSRYGTPSHVHMGVH